MLAAMEAGKPLAASAMNDEQLKATRSFPPADRKAGW